MDDRNLWKIKSEETRYSCERYDLVVYDTINPADKPMEYPVMRYKQKSTAVCAVDDKGYLYIVGQWRFGAGYYSWEVIEGRSDPGETPDITIKRELKEEAGLTAKEWKYLGMFYPNNVLTDEEVHVYIARGLTQGETSPDEHEKLTVKKVRFLDFLQNVIQGKITDGITVSAVLMAYFHLKEELENITG